MCRNWSLDNVWTSELQRKITILSQSKTEKILLLTVDLMVKTANKNIN